MSDRLKQWMGNLPSVLVDVVHGYLGYADWIVHRFPPGVWGDLCHMLTSSHGYGSPINPVRKALTGLQTSDMYTIPFHLFMKLAYPNPNDIEYSGLCGTDCDQPRRLLDLMACTGEVGFTRMTVCANGHFFFARGKREVTTSQYLVLWELEHQMILVSEQEDDVSFIRRREAALQKEVDDLLKSWYP